MPRAAWTLLVMALLAAHVDASGDGSNATTAAPTAPAGAAQLCDAQLLFQKLYVLMPAINQCATESDYFIKPSNLSMPSDASLAKYCGSKNCSLLSQELDNAGLPSCSVAVGNTTMAFKVFFKNIKDHCDSSAASNASSPSTAPAGNGATRSFSLASQVLLAALVLCALVTV